MNNNRVAKPVQERVKRWMNYTWANQNTFDENKALEFLPPKMRTDIAMRVHFATLGRRTKLTMLLINNFYDNFINIITTL